ncbi:GspH/FimT family pseudopilin [Sedimenticola hydrogenitrophicus]|uniref:GspH/FimT family pseudopilin n=1 Tax=Sedimenticola hydrogenitrophicus TaxID=2967975 RepID=UPI0023B03BDB|nr:GspH/FimT family pseudopilin [Sedimenticola hydrogenitrophicus]
MALRTVGFTLIELLITLVILVILATIGIPSFTDFIRNQNAKRGAHEVMAALAYTRSEAIKRNTSVTITANNAPNWEEGWSITSGGDTLRIMNALDGLDISGPNAAITFTSNGRAANLTFEVCNTDKSQQVKKRTVTLDSSGRAENEIDGDCST